MIKKINKKYETKVMKYLSVEKEINTFNFHEIRLYGFDNFFYKIYADLDDDDNIRGLLFKCFDYLSFYSHDDFDVEGVCKLISDMHFTEISGKYTPLALIADKLGLFKFRKVNLCKLEAINEVETNIPEHFKLKRINFFNYKKIVKLYEEINEFQNIKVENLKANLKTGRGYCIEYNKKAISMAKSTAENSDTAMVIGVGTHSDYRNQGLATYCVVKLCEELLSENIVPCLLYESECAGKLYKKLGFETIDTWATYYK